jgi:hypothetical protein
VNAIVVAHSGRIAMLNAVFGSEAPADPKNLPEAGPGIFSRKR